MLGRILRAWRRVVVGILLLTLSMAAAYFAGIGDVPEDIANVSTPVEVAILVAAWLILCVMLVGGAVALLAAIAPGLLPMVDMLLGALVIAVPLSAGRDALGLPAWVDCLVLGAAAHGIGQVTSGVWLTGLARRDTRPRRLVFQVPDPVDAVWSRIVPLPGNSAEFYMPKAVFMAAPEGLGADFVLHAPRRRHLLQSPEAYWIEALEPGRAVTFRHAPLDGGADVAERQTFRLEPVGTRTRVDLEVRFLDVPLFRRIRLWLNNDPYEYLVSLRNRARGRRDRTIHGRQLLPA